MARIAWIPRLVLVYRAVALSAVVSTGVRGHSGDARLVRRLVHGGRRARGRVRIRCLHRLGLLHLHCLVSRWGGMDVSGRRGCAIISLGDISLMHLRTSRGSPILLVAFLLGLTCVGIRVGRRNRAMVGYLAMAAQ